MASYKKILLCYDGTLEGRKALRCGADLALELKAETHLLSVVDMRSSIAQSAGLLTDVACSRFEETAREILQEGVDWLTERGVHAQGHFAFGYPIDEIANLATKLNVDLVVVGHRCRSGLSRWWMGGPAIRNCSTGCRAAFWWRVLRRPNRKRKARKREPRRSDTDGPPVRRRAAGQNGEWATLPPGRGGPMRRARRRPTSVGDWDRPR